MPQIVQKIILIFALIVLSLGWTASSSYAAIGMDRVKNVFENETGKQWDQATSEEKKNFLRDFRGREGFQQEIEFKGKNEKRDVGPRTVEGITLSEQKEELAPYYIREGYEKNVGRVWEKATKKQQERYWNNYLKKEEKQKTKNVKYLENQKRAEQKRIQERKLKEEKNKRKKEIRAQKKKKELEAKKRKRAKMKRKIKKQKEKIKKMKAKAKKKR